MNISLFDIIGPIMTGPSSSHTAGAAKLARVAMQIAEKPFSKVDFGLHGSFAKTGLGHGTDKALLAGILGLREDDEAIKDVYKLADKRNLVYTFYSVDLGDVHENSCLITFWHTDGTKTEIIGSSIGGGRILIHSIDGVKADIGAELPTLIIKHYDKKGVISNITNLLYTEQINISVMWLSREEKGGHALTIIETDDEIPLSVSEKMLALDNIIGVRVIRV